MPFTPADLLPSSDDEDEWNRAAMAEVHKQRAAESVPLGLAYPKVKKPVRGKKRMHSEEEESEDDSVQTYPLTAASKPLSASAGSGMTRCASSQRALIRDVVHPARRNSQSVRAAPTARKSKRRVEPRIGTSSPLSSHRSTIAPGKPQCCASSSKVNVRSLATSTLTRDLLLGLRHAGQSKQCAMEKTWFSRDRGR